MTFATFLSSLIPSASCDAPEEKEEKVEADAEEPEEKEAEGEEEEEEEEEPEDQMVGLREACQQSGSCVKFTEHFAHCQEKVEAGEGFKGEDCVEEMFHMMHCVDNCVAPKLFAKLR
ncbi:Non-heme protein of cytochrome bc1 complex [Phellopilus nigrolimitatus]|nr:Non-heme protein of cytochrome bc1 complex [Phellopilus nigrolimitatus]